MLKLYEKVDVPKLVTSPREAEMIKYTSNAFLATKITFMNEMARLCDRLGVDVSEVSKGMGMDPKIVQADYRLWGDPMKGDFIFDGRNALDWRMLHKQGFQYWGVGRNLLG
jgi:hypothetical protein